MYCQHFISTNTSLVQTCFNYGLLFIHYFIVYCLEGMFINWLCWWIIKLFTVDNCFIEHCDIINEVAHFSMHMLTLTFNDSIFHLISDYKVPPQYSQLSYQAKLWGTICFSNLNSGSGYINHTNFSGLHDMYK